MKRIITLLILILFFPMSVQAFNFNSLDYILDETITTDTSSVDVTTEKIIDEENAESFEKNDIVENVIDESKNLVEYFKEEEGRRLLIEIGLVALDIIILIIIIVKIKNYKLNKQLNDL